MVAEKEQALFLEFFAEFLAYHSSFFNFSEAQSFSKWIAVLYKQHIMSIAFQQYLPTPPKHGVVFASVWNSEPVGMQGFLIMELSFLTDYKSLFLVEKEGDVSQQGCI